MEIHLIWAQDYNGGIGKSNRLPWQISEDLKNFKSLTLNSTVIMGRKTWDSLPFKPLPSRRNIVLSSQSIKGVEVYHNYDTCNQSLISDSIEKIFIIGGSRIYKLFFEYADFLHITFVDLEINGIDTFFPYSFNNIKKNFVQQSKKTLNETALYTLWSKK